VFTALDVHEAGVSLDEFLAAVEAEDVVSRTPLAAWLRARGGRDERLWGTLPASLDNML
jgi:hypothetical protein